MDFYDEKDYIMRMIKEMVKVLFSLMFGKQYNSVELPKENKYEVSGKQLKDLLTMIDHGNINDAETMMLSNLDYGNRSEVAAAILLYRYHRNKVIERCPRSIRTKNGWNSGLQDSSRFFAGAAHTVLAFKYGYF